LRFGHEKRIDGGKDMNERKTAHRRRVRKREVLGNSNPAPGDHTLEAVNQ